jgi:hypothetical protein
MAYLLIIPAMLALFLFGLTCFCCAAIVHGVRVLIGRPAP